MKRLIIVGSPRTNGRSAHLAEMIFESNIDEHPEDELFLVPVSEVEVGPCIGCNGCRETSGVILKDEDGAEVTVQRHRCVFDDDMQMLYDVLDDVDEVTVVSPLYFSGAPAPMKCVLDRLQPYFWANARAAEKRPAELHVIGEGGDPHGFMPLLTEVKSALAVAGFRLEKVFDWVGKIDENGEITAEAAVVDTASSAPAGIGGHGGSEDREGYEGREDREDREGREDREDCEGQVAESETNAPNGTEDAARSAEAARVAGPGADMSNGSNNRRQRPKLDLSAGKGGSRKSAANRSRGGREDARKRTSQSGSQSKRKPESRGGKKPESHGGKKSESRGGRQPESRGGRQPDRKRNGKNARAQGGRRG